MQIAYYKNLKQCCCIIVILFLTPIGLSNLVKADELEANKNKLPKYEYIDIFFENIPSFGEIKVINPTVKEYSILSFHANSMARKGIYCYQSKLKDKSSLLTNCSINLELENCSDFNSSYICNLFQNKKFYNFIIKKFNKDILSSFVQIGSWPSLRPNRSDGIAHDKIYYIVLYRSYKDEEKSIRFNIKIIDHDDFNKNRLFSQVKKLFINQYRILDIPEHYNDSYKKRAIKVVLE